MSILELPDELLCYLLTYAEDTDLQNLALTCKHLRRLVYDSHLRHQILLIRNSARLSSSLSLRPSRGELASQNILRGVHIQQHIRQGAYINGESSVRSYQVSCRLERQFLSQRISRKLMTRPSWLDLVERGLLPQEMFVREEEDETRRRWTEYNTSLGQTQRQLRMLRFEEGEDEDKEVDHECKYAEMGDYNIQQHHYHHNQPEEDNVGKLVDMTYSTTITPSFAPSSSCSAPPPSQSPSSLPRRRKNISMVLIPKMERLRKAMERDRLSRLVQRRPSPQDLRTSPKLAVVLQTYHLVAYSSTSPALVPTTAHLHFLLRAERLRHWFHHSRPSLATMLNERHYLKTEPRTAWMVCPGVGPNVRFYEQLIQQSLAYRQQQEEYQASRKKF